MAKAHINVHSDLDHTKFDRGLAAMRQGVTAFTSGQLRSIAGMVSGAFAVNSLINFGRNALQQADNLGNFSNAVGLSTDTLQSLVWAIKEFGAGTEESARAKLLKLVDAQGVAILGNKAMIATFERLGISEKDVAKLDTANLLLRVAEGARASGTAVADLNDLFGRGAAFEMQQALEKLAEVKLDGLRAEAVAAGQVLQEELIDRMGVFNDDLDRTITQTGNALIKAAAVITNIFKDLFAFLGAASSVGIREAVWQMRHGEIGTASERKTVKKGIEYQQDQERAERERSLAERKAKEQAVIDKKKKAVEDDRAEALAKVKDEKQAAISVAAPQAADQYARIGLFSGGQVQNKERAIAERQLEVAKEMRKRLDKIEEINERAAKALEKIDENTGS
jgi:hypothetical protein